MSEVGAEGRLPFADGTFDLVTANQVFEHIRDFEPPLDEIGRGAFRLRGRRLAGLLDVPLARPAARVGVRLLAGLVVSTKPGR